jgi:hypothetical protein
MLVPTAFSSIPCQKSCNTAAVLCTAVDNVNTAVDNLNTNTTCLSFLNLAVGCLKQQSLCLKQQSLCLKQQSLCCDDITLCHRSHCGTFPFGTVACKLHPFPVPQQQYCLAVIITNHLSQSRTFLVGDAPKKQAADSGDTASGPSATAAVRQQE